MFIKILNKIHRNWHLVLITVLGLFGCRSGGNDADTLPSSALVEDAFELMDRDEYAEALVRLTSALKDDPHNFIVKAWIAYCHFQIGEDGKAIDAANKVVDAISDEMASSDEHLRRAKAWALSTLGEINFRDGQISEAKRNAEQAIALEPLLSTPKAVLADIYSIRKDFNAAKKWYDEILKYEPNYGRALSGKARILWQQRKYEQAHQVIEKGLQRTPDDPFLLKERGIIFFEAQEYAAAEKDFRKALLYNPNDAIVWSEMANALDLQEKFAEAEKAYRMAINLNPELSRVHLNLAICLARQGKLEQAFKEITIEEQKFPVTDPRVYQLKFKILTNFGKDKEAALAEQQLQELLNKLGQE